MRLFTFTSSTIVLLCTFIFTVICTPDIGIRNDWFDSHPDLVSFSGVLVFNAKSDGNSPVPDLSDGLLVGICAKAFDEMRSAEGNHDKPQAMALLAVGNEIYHASSIMSDRNNWLGKGRGVEDQRPQILARAAGAARIAGSTHRIGGACAEINIMDLYHYRNKDLNFAGKRARIVVWATKDGDTNIFNPCSTPLNGYGCRDFLKAIANPSDPKLPLKDENLKVIAKQTSRDNGWPDGLQFMFSAVRLTQGDKEACEMLAKDPYDPNDPDQMQGI